ncbi:MAG: hypothetical protein LBG29_01365 [Synergistaceae bacterium]|jgi:hypothetical protein|nr:hypothetical protein [Synergistaceae bacterium]
MRIRLDDVDLALGSDILDGGKEAIYGAAKRLALDNNCVITDILVDGESVAEESVFFALSGGLDIRFVSKPVKDLIPESIAEGHRYIPLLEAGLDSVATLFEQGSDQDALSRFAQCVEGIDWLMAVFGKCETLLNIQPESFQCGNYSEYIEDFNRTQREILSSMEGGKNMRVAFLIRDELIPLINRFSRFWDEAKTQAETQPQ